MPFSRVVFSSQSGSWATSEALYTALDEEFHFTLDPCPLDPDTDGLVRSWYGERVFCNPPYGRGIVDWLAEATEAEVAVYLLPSRTDTRWFQSIFQSASQVLFLRGRLRFGEARNSAPFPSALVLYGQGVSSLQPLSDWGYLVRLDQSHLHDSLCEA